MPTADTLAGTLRAALSKAQAEHDALDGIAEEARKKAKDTEAAFRKLHARRAALSEAIGSIKVAILLSEERQLRIEGT